MVADVDAVVSDGSGGGNISGVDAVGSVVVVAVVVVGGGGGGGGGGGAGAGTSGDSGQWFFYVTWRIQATNT